MIYYSGLEACRWQVAGQACAALDQRRDVSDQHEFERAKLVEASGAHGARDSEPALQALHVSCVQRLGGLELIQERVALFEQLNWIRKVSS